MAELEYGASPAQAIERLRADLDEEIVLSRASAAVTASGDTGPLAVNSAALAVDINVTALAGTTPSVTFFLDRRGADGVYYRVWSSAAITAVGQASTSIGAGLAVNVLPSAEIRLGWTVAGTVPSITFSASIVGR